jgi:rhamnosyltransferase
MDSDSKWQTDIIEVYKEYISHNDVSKTAIIGPQHNYQRHKRFKSHYYSEKKRIMLSGCLMNVGAIEKLGDFDERFFIDGLDYEWCYRAIKNGLKIIECGDAIVDHSPGIEKQIKIFDRTVFRYGWAPPDRYYYQFKAMRIIHFQYHDLAIDLHAIYKPLKVLFLFSRKKEYFDAWIRARKDYNLGYFGKYPNTV